MDATPGMQRQAVSLEVAEGYTLEHAVCVAYNRETDNYQARHHTFDNATASLGGLATLLRNMADALDAQEAAEAKLANTWGVPEGWA
jgi:hypothetical protein